MKNKLAQGNKIMPGEDDHPIVELGRGYIDHLDYLNGRIHIVGWMLLPDRSIDGFVLKVNNVSFGPARLVKRDDVHGAFPGIPTTLYSGFEVDTKVPEETLRDWTDIDIIGIYNDQEIAKISTVYKLDFRASLKEPPASLMHRVANVENSNTYWCRALTSFNEFNKAISKHCDPGSIKRLLDWGCGCGRVTSLFLKYSNIPEIHGCDIDKEAVSWCAENLKQGHFSTINPYPPTDFDDRMFDVITGYSVFTHLTRDVQLSWLEEMKRILNPGGFFFASVNGEFASLFSGPSVVKDIQENGISDGHMDSILDGIAPTGYYRAVFQSKAYTLDQFGKHFRIVDYVERGMGNFQDLVVMQKEN